MERKHTSEIVDNVIYQLRKRKEYLIDYIDQIYDDCGVDYGDRGLSGIIPWNQQEIIHIINSELDQLEKLLKGIMKLNK
tara:strand:- start:2084 stop:2320 length:237 start_codon:yes stop_codon:yes gene_type:complete